MSQRQTQAVLYMKPANELHGFVVWIKILVYLLILHGTISVNVLVF